MLAAVGGRVLRPETIQPAVDALNQAADDYRSSRPINDGHGHQIRQGVAEARRQLGALGKSLRRAETALEKMPIEALSSFRGAYGYPIGKLKTELARSAPAAEDALRALDDVPDKERDHHKAVLAIQVAVIFRDILQIKPAATLDTHDVTGKRGGAAYARVLRKTFEVAGVPLVDIGTLIKAGLLGLSDPDLPHNIK